MCRDWHTVLLLATNCMLAGPVGATLQMPGTHNAATPVPAPAPPVPTQVYDTGQGHQGPMVAGTHATRHWLVGATTGHSRYQRKQLAAELVPVPTGGYHRGIHTAFFYPWPLGYSFALPRRTQRARAGDTRSNPPLNSGRCKFGTTIQRSAHCQTPHP